MRLLYLPHTSSPGTLSTEHSYANALTLFGKWVRRYPHTSVYWLVPRNALKEQRAAFYPIEDVIHRFKFIEVDMDAYQIKEQCTLPPEIAQYFDLVQGKYFFDCLFCEKPSVLTQLFGAVQLWTRSRPHKVVVANFHYTLDADREVRLLPCIEMNQVVNAVEADIFQFGSTGKCIDSWGQYLDKLRKYVAPHIVKDAIAKPRWVKMSSNIEELQAKFATWDGKKDPKFTVQFGCSLNTLFSFERLYKALERFRMTERDFRFKITTPAMSSGRLSLDPSWCDIHVACPRPRFFDLSLGSHCFIIWPDAPAGINHGGVNEMARLGVLPLFHASSMPYPWCEKMQNYQFVFKGESELLALLKWVKKNYDSPAVKLAIKSNQEMLDAVYTGEGSYEYKIDYIEKEFRERIKKTPPFCPMREVLTKLPDRMTMAELVTHVKETSDTGIDLDKLIGARPYFVGTKDDIRLAMFERGYQDVGDPETVIFEKEVTA